MSPIRIAAGGFMAVATAGAVAGMYLMKATEKLLTTIVPPEQGYPEAGPSLWRSGDIVEHLDHGHRIEVWAIGTDKRHFADSTGTLWHTADYKLVQLRESEEEETWGII